MTPEVRAYLDKAAEDLADARKIHAISLYKVAARCAYYVAFHAAEALLLARTGRIAKLTAVCAPDCHRCCPAKAGIY